MPIKILPIKILCVMICLVSSATAWGQPPAGEDDAPKYPLAVALDGDAFYTVDLDLPGVWRVDGEGRKLYVRGTRLLRKPLNRPRCVAIHPAGGILVGDSATREVYHIESAAADPKPLTQGTIGIAMAIAVSPDGKTIYVGDAEKRSLLKLPIEGGKSELVALINARGLSFDTAGMLWAVTPDAEAVHKIDVATGTSEAIVTGRPYQYPNGLVWAGDRGFVTDGYGKAIWTFSADGKTEIWHQGDPLVGPVGIAIDDQAIWVADPKQKQVYRFDRSSKTGEPRL